jgi:hypothetical protein
MHLTCASLKVRNQFAYKQITDGQSTGFPAPKRIDRLRKSFIYKALRLSRLRNRSGLELLPKQKEPKERQEAIQDQQLKLHLVTGKPHIAVQLYHVTQERTEQTNQWNPCVFHLPFGEQTEGIEPKQWTVGITSRHEKLTDYTVVV